MTEQTTILSKAQELYGKAAKLVTVNRAARRILRELNELINTLEEYIHYNIEYDKAEVGTKLKYYEKQLQLVERKRELFKFFREVSKKQGSLPENADDEEFLLSWIKEKGYELCSYSKAEALERLDELEEGEVVEEEDPLGSGLDLWCLKVRR
ncbi:hypothetical protein [Saccharolobus caldissimus]|uniref:Uncharacterized protein n=1 Tax=Saccharolobus caldissimus TaxID=1702097 RepID=A0AAQ4CMG3_9CREN|nr:hypothetical protein [Saccharolobus caldissimus]BDB96994.1 hypothetical protein SACC_00110 [Saccharolobus caldissimus]